MLSIQNHEVTNNCAEEVLNAKHTEEGINKEKVISVTAVSLVLKKLPFTSTTTTRTIKTIKRCKDHSTNDYVRTLNKV